MPTLSATAVLLFCAGALGVGLLAGWACVRLRIGAAYVPAHAHRAALAAMRQRYRRRLRAMRDAAVRQRASEDDLLARLRTANDHQASRARQLAEAKAELDTLQQRIASMRDALTERDQRLSAARLREAVLTGELAQARERIAAFESEHGLMRIERDELVARTARLRALPSPDESAPAQGGLVAESPAPLRTELADRDARIHELEYELRESTGRVTQLETSLQTWKYRIAPLALYMKQRRERGADAAAAAAPAVADDLKRIHGIGRALEKKLHAEGIRSFAQVAALSPAELANLAVRLGVAASRPLRDGWAEQACELQGGSAAPAPRAARREAAKSAG